MLLQQGERRLEVGGLAEPAARGSRVSIAAADLSPPGAVDPVQQPAGVICAGVGTHEVEHGSDMLDQVAGQPDGAGEGVGADGPGPTVAKVLGEVQEAGEAADGAGELGRPAGQMG
jgi:hypothetical protein